jgi:hypothetical protein
MKLAQKKWQVAAGLYFLLLLTIVLLADTGNLPVELLSKIPHYDTAGHFILYGIASFLSHRAINRRMLVIFNFPLPLGPLIFSIVTIIEEMLQELLPNRTFSLTDMGASLLGIVLFYWLGEKFFPAKK